MRPEGRIFPQNPSCTAPIRRKSPLFSSRSFWRPAFAALLALAALSPAWARSTEEKSATITPSSTPSSSPKSGAAAAAAVEAPSGEVAKIVVKEEGIYRVAASDLLAAGVALDGVETRRINLLNCGKPVAIRIRGGEDGRFDSTDAIEFWGTFAPGETTTRGMYSEENAYILTLDAGEPSRLLEMNTPPKGASNLFKEKGVFFRRVHWEDNYYFPFFENARGNPTDFFFWNMLDTMRNANMRHFFYSSDLGACGTSVTLRIKVYGRSDLPVNPDHRVALFLNDKPAGSFDFDGVVDYVYETNKLSDAALLAAGQNTLRIALPGDLPEAIRVSPALNAGGAAGETPKAFDQIMLDWCEIEYPVRFAAAEDQFNAFVRAGGSSSNSSALRVEGFSSAQVTAIDRGNQRFLPVRMESLGNGQYAAVFPVQINSQTQVAAAGESKILRPLRIEPLRARDLVAEFKNKELLIISHEKFLGALDPLVKHKVSRGVATGLVGIGEVYNQCNWGVKDPQAIRNLLKGIKSAPDSRLKYVLLVGTAAQDPKKLSDRPGIDLIPVKFFQSINFAPYATDNWYVSWEGIQGEPQLAIGRIPARNESQVQNVVEKIIAFETAEHDRVPNRTLLVASVEQGFQAKMDEVAKKITEAAPKMEFIRAYADPNTQTDSGYLKTVSDAIDGGVRMVLFGGHGAARYWRTGIPNEGRQNLFDPEHVASLRNEGRYPIILTATCFATYFDIPQEDEAIGLQLVHRAKGGGVAIVGSNYRSFFDTDMDFVARMVQSLYSPQTRTLGDAFLEAKKAMRDRETRESIALLGDPSLDTAWLKE